MGFDKNITWLLKNHVLFWTSLWVLLLQACNYAKHVPQDEKLLWQNRIELKKDIKLEEKDEIMAQIDAAIAQKPNKVLFDLDLETANIGYVMPRHKLILYNVFYKRLQKDSNSALKKYKVVQEPVIFSKTAVENSKREIKDLLFNKGYFYASVTDVTTFKHNKKVAVTYVIEPGKNYVVNNINYFVSDSNLKTIVQAQQQHSYIQKGNPLVLTDLSKERSRLNTLFLQNGYCNFSPSSISFVPDTVNKALFNSLDDPFALAGIISDTAFTNYNKADVNVYITENPKSPFKKCIVNNTYVYLLQKGEIKNDSIKYQEQEINGVIFKYTKCPVKLDLIAKNIFVKSGDLYTSQNNIITQTRLNNLGFFRNIKVYYQELPEDVNGMHTLDCFIEMTMGDKYDFQYSTDVFNSSTLNTQSGTNLTFTLQDNNFLKGINKFNVNLLGGLQGILFSKTTPTTISQYNFGSKVNLLMPKFLFLNKKVSPSRYSLPTTTITAGYDYNFRQNRYSLSNANAELAYSWNESLLKNWRIKPISISRIKPNIIDEDFKTQIESSVILKRLFQPYLIIGHSITYEYNGRLGNNQFQKRNNMLRLSLEESGGLAAGISSIVLGKVSNEITNYVRLEADYRNYRNTKHTNWVNRAFVGFGLPYLNSLSLPISKQFSVGGANSMRGWRSKRNVAILGPGSYLDTLSKEALLSSGDIKLELNTEYRFDVTKMFGGTFMLEGAGFVDVGNVWMFYDEANRPNTGFKLNKLYSDLGVNTGLGMRLDFDLMVLRIDWGVQVKRPYYTQNNGWNLSDYHFFDNDWLRNNTALQLGFNYPF